MNYNSSAKYFEKIKEGYEKRLMKGIKIFPKKKRRKRRQYGRQRCKILPGHEK